MILCISSYELQVVKLVRAIRMGLIKFDKPKEEQRFYPLWGDDSSSTDKANHLAYIPAPKPKLPGIDVQPPYCILNITSVKELSTNFTL